MTEPIFRGMHSLASKHTNIARSTITDIFNAKKRASPKQAIALAKFFKSRGVDLTKEDLVFNIKKGEKLIDFYERKLENRETNDFKIKGEKIMENQTEKTVENQTEEQKNIAIAMALLEDVLRVASKYEDLIDPQARRAIVQTAVSMLHYSEPDKKQPSESSPVVF